MTELIDTNLDVRENTVPKNKLNGLLLAAYLLFAFGSGNISNIYENIYKGMGSSDYIWITIIDLTATIGGALISDLLRQTRILNLVGISLLIVLNLAAYSTSAITGYPLALLTHLAIGCVTFPLMKRLVAHTGFFGRTQKTVLLSMAAMTVFSMFFRQFIFALKINPQENTGHLLISTLTMITALVLVAIDREEEPTPVRYSDFIQRHPTFWTYFFIPIVLITLVLTWGLHQTNRIYLFGYFYGHDREWLVVTAMATMLLSFGLLALLALTLQVNNHWVYLATGSILLLLLIILQLNQGDQENNNAWLMAILDRMAMSAIGFGLSVWILRYTYFPFLALLLLMQYVGGNLSYLISDYLHLNIF